MVLLVLPAFDHSGSLSYLPRSSQSLFGMQPGDCLMFHRSNPSKKHTKGSREEERKVGVKRKWWWIKWGGDWVVDWIWRLCNMAFESGVVPEGWRSAAIVPLYEGKGEI